MPREYLHWALAERISQRLKRNSALKTIIEQYKHIYLAGSIILDTPLYFTFGREAESFKEISISLHQNNKNSFAPLIRLLREYHETLKEATWALIAGIITHIIADAQFHPMIFYFSGVSTDENKGQAIMRHRTIETALDMLCFKSYSHVCNLLFENIMKHKEIDNNAFYGLLACLYNVPLNKAHLIRKAITQHALIQKIFRKKQLKILSQFLNIIPGVHLDEIIPLFYSLPQSPRPFLVQRPILFRHPITGVSYQKSINDMEENTVVESLKVFKFIDDNWKQQSMIDAFSQLRGPNLTTGMVGTFTKNMRYFDTKKNLNKLF